MRRPNAAGVKLAAMVWAMTGLAGSAAAQGASPPGKPVAAAEVTAGYGWFLDEGAIGHGVVGGALRFHLSPRISIGPEVIYMKGPGDDRDLFLTANVTFDLVNARRGSPGLVTPFLVAGGGLFNMSNRFGGVGFSSWEGAFTAGGGVRVWMTRRVYAATEFRTGWEPHIRFTGTVGVAFD